MEQTSEVPKLRKPYNFQTNLYSANLWFLTWFPSPQQAQAHFGGNVCE